MAQTLGFAKFVSISAFESAKKHRKSHPLIGGVYGTASAVINIGKAAKLVALDFNTSPDQSSASSAASSPSISRKGSSMALIKTESASMVLTDLELLHGVPQDGASYEHSSGITSGIDSTEDGLAMPAISAPTVISYDVLQAQNRSMAVLELEEKEPLAAAEAGERAGTSRTAMKHASSMDLTCKQSLSSSKAANDNKNRSTSPNARATHQELQRTVSHRGFGTVTRYVLLFKYVCVYICVCDMC
jgi:hypothetical protein